MTKFHVWLNFLLLNVDNVKFECDQKCRVNAGDNYYSEKTRANFNEKLVKNYSIKLPYLVFILPLFT